MASGYEKAACGVDPNKGWGKPTRRDRWLSLLYLVIALPLLWGWILVVVWRALFAAG
jgi:hypothetical protein